MIKSGLAGVVDAHTRVLVLGSLPGERSLAMAQYYAHPQNQFWRLMQAVTGADLVGAAYPDRLARLLSAGVGVWDVIGSARREGSLDASIRDPAANDLAAFVATLPALRAVAFNGGKALAIGSKRLGDATGLTRLALPSSSPAHTLSFERKLAAWLAIRPFLDPPDDATETAPGAVDQG